jgi:hypothetical protein
MKQFSEWMQLNEVANTVLSDAQEIAAGFYILNGPSGNIKSGKWYSADVKSQFESRAKQMTKEELDDVLNKSRVMAAEFLKWATSNGYAGVKQVWWTARPGSMTAAVGEPVDQKKNPSDILVKFRSGPANGFLGLSAKATHGGAGAEIGFSNPGIGTIDSDLGLNLASFAKSEEEKILKALNVPSLSAKERKAWLRAHPSIRAKTQEAGSKILSALRDQLLKKLQSFDMNKLYKYLLSSWLSADVLYPPYIKVTATSSGGKSYAAHTTDPVNNPKLKALGTRKIKLQPLGNESILVIAGDKNIFKMRFKNESEKLASAIKMSGDPAK